MKRSLPLALLLFLIALATVLVLILRGDSGDANPTISSTAPLTGRLIDDRQEPIDGAFVFVGEAATRTAADGSFVFYDLPAGEHEVDASADGFTRPGSGSLGRTTVYIPAEDAPDSLELTLPRAASLSGQILAGDEPLYGASLSLSYIEAKGIVGQDLEPFNLARVATSDAQGAFSLGAVAPGRLQILVESQDYPFAESHEIILYPGQRLRNLRIDVAPAGGIRGTVVNEEGEALEARLTLTSLVDGRTRTTMSDIHGRYHFRTLQAGDYTLYVQAEGHRGKRVDSLIVESDEVFDRDILLTPQSLFRGQALEPDGSPAPYANIQLIHHDRTHHLVTDGEGRFTYDASPDQGWRAQAFSPHHDPSPLLPITPGTDIELQLAPGGTIFGEVVDARGRIVTGYQISAATLETANPFLHAGRFPSLQPQDQRGRFEFGPLPSGRVRLRVTAEGHPVKVTDAFITRSGQRTGPIRIQLDAGAEIEGYVVDGESGEPVVGAQLFLLASGLQRPTATTDLFGHFHVQGLPSGLHSFQITHPNYLIEIFSGITIPPASSDLIEFELTPIGDGPPGYTFHGIGAALRREQDQIFITSFEEDSPAALAGLQVGDRLRAVDGEGVENLTLEQVVERIRGEDGEPVTLEIHRQGLGIREIIVERERVIVARPTH